MDSVADAVSLDPERESLGEVLRNWWDCYQAKPVTAAQVIKDMDDHYNSETYKALKDAIMDLINAPNLTAKTLGRVLGYREGRIVDGMSLHKAGSHKKTIVWKMKHTADF